MDPFARRRLGRTGVSIGQLGFGGAPLGELYRKLCEATAQSTLEEAYRLGLRFFDTSPWYGHGLSEHRLGHFLRRQPRESFVLSTKVGRVYTAPADLERVDTGPWAGGLPFVLRFDYTYDGVKRSYEDSLQRLGLNRVDLLLIHDLDFHYHGTEAAVEHYFRQLETGGWKALDELKSSGTIRGIGAGINQMGIIPRFLDRFDIDFFLVAMPYTLLDQEPLHAEFPRCVERGVGIVVGAPFASGILATGPVENAKYNYAPAPAGIADKVGRIESLCGRHGVPLAAAALQFPLGHPIVAAVIPGAVSPAQVAANVRMMRIEIPAGLWQELRDDGLIHAEAPTP
ncbi:MAG: aldo/keto reductase [Kiloniellaceae bacterium]